jgi:hypothetical protein
MDRMTLWQQVRSAVRSKLVSGLPTKLSGSGLATPTVYTVQPRQQAVLPYVVAERVSDVREQALEDSPLVTTLDFQVRIVSLAEGTNPVGAHSAYEDAVREVLERTQLTLLVGWTVCKINYLQSLTIQENDDGLVSVLEFTLIGQASS